MRSRATLLLLMIGGVLVDMVLPGLISAGAVSGLNKPAPATKARPALAGVASPRYIVTDIGLVPGTVLAGVSEQRVLRMNDSGQVVGNAFSLTNFGDIGYLYSGGMLTSLSPLRSANAINNVGQIAGSTGRPVVRNSNGSITSLGLLPGDNNGGDSLGINDSGQVVGISRFRFLIIGIDDPTDYFRAFLYSNGVMQDLGFGQFSAAYAINNSGQIVGGTFRDFFALFHSNGVTTNVGMKIVFRAINNSGQATGRIQDANNRSHALLYANGATQDLGTLPGDSFSVGFGISEHGEVVGTSAACCQISDRARAFIYSNGVMEDLNDLIPAGSGVFLDAAYDINEVGQIAAGGRLGNGGPFHPFLLTPVQNFNVCLQDESDGSVFVINTTTGDYQFINCGGLTLGGTGKLNIRGGVVTLQHYAGDRRILARLDMSVNKGTATIGLFSPGRRFTITDRNISNNSCNCAAR